jgi:hypothetical protein
VGSKHPHLAERSSFEVPVRALQEQPDEEDEKETEAGREKE